MDRRLDDIFQNGHMGPEIEMLKNHSQPAADAVHLSGILRNGLFAPVFLHPDQFAGNKHISRIRRFQKIDAPKQGAFPRTAGADQGNDVAFIGRQGNAFQHLKRAETLVNILNNNGFG